MKKRIPLLFAILVFTLMCTMPVHAASFYGEQGYYLNDEYVPFGKIEIDDWNHPYYAYGVGQYINNNIYYNSPLKITEGGWGSYGKAAVINYYDGKTDQRIQLPFADLRLWRAPYTGSMPKVPEYRYGTSKENINTEFAGCGGDSDDVLSTAGMPLIPSTTVNNQLPFYVAYVAHRFYTVTFHVPQGVLDETTYTCTTMDGGSVVPPPLPETHVWDTDSYLNVNEKQDVYAISLCENHVKATDAAVPPTCTEPGLTEGSHCAVCNEVMVPQKEVPALGHTVVVDPAVEPKNGNPGLSEGSHCSVCGTVFVPQRELSYSGKCGTNASWYLDTDGTMTIQGTGLVSSYTYPAYVLQNTVRIEIGEGIKGLSASPFSSFSSVQSIVIPASLTYIGTGGSAGYYESLITLQGYAGLTEFVVSEENPVFSSVEGFLCNRAGTRIYRCPKGKAGDVVIPAGITDIAYGAFYQCSKITGVTFTYEVESIDSGAFQGMTGVTYVVPKGSEAYDWARSNGYPYSVVSIFDYTWETDGLTITKYKGPAGSDVYVPKYIDHMKVTAIGDSVFSYKDIKKAVLPDSILRIGNSAFYENIRLTEINLPEGLLSIGSSAFNNCVNLSSLTLPESITSIGSSAFSGVPATFYASLESNKAKALSKAGIAFWVPDTGFQMMHLMSGDNITGLRICASSVEEGVLEIPYGVTEIGDNAIHVGETEVFEGRTGLTGVVFPETVSHIWYGAFRNCAGLTHVQIGNKDCIIEREAFKGCTSLRYIRLGNRNIESEEPVNNFGSCGPDAVWYSTVYGDLTIDGQGPVNDYSYVAGGYGSVTCNEPWYNLGSGVGSLDIHEGITSIGAYAFAKMTGIKSINVPLSVSAIGESAFLGVTADVFYIPTVSNKALVQNYGGTLNWVKPGGSCGEDAGWYMYDETTLVLTGPGAVTEAGWSGYTGDVNTVVINENVSGIGTNLLGSIPGLQRVVFLGDPPVLAGGAFYGLSADAYYRHGCSGWTKNVRKNYGGQIVWKQFCDWHDGDVVPADIHHVDGAEPSCTEPGVAECWRCAVCGSGFTSADAVSFMEEDDYILPALGHNVPEPVFRWEEDGSFCEVEFACTRCDNVDILDAEVSTETEGEVPGITRYIAVVTYQEKTYTDTFEVKREYTITLNGAELADAGQGNSFLAGTEVAIKALPEEGQILAGWLSTDTGHPIEGNEQNITVRIPDHDIEVTALYVNDPAIPAQIWNGAAVEPGFDVVLNGELLEKDTAYMVSYSDNVNVGTASVTITSVGEPAWTVDTAFEILPLDITVTGIGSSQEYDGTVKMAGGVEVSGLPTGITLTGITWSAEGSDVGEYEGIFEGSAVVRDAEGNDVTGNLVVSCVNGCLTITPKPIADTEIRVSDEEISYTGYAVEPEIRVYLGDEELVPGTDYTVSYQDNTEPGTGKYVVAGIGNYTGEADGTFVIAKAGLEKALMTIEEATYIYTGSPIEPNVLITLDGAVLTEGKDYSLSWEDNTAAGTAAVMATGMGYYEGTVTAEFVIDPKPIDGAVVSAEDVLYTGAELTTEVEVLLDERMLILDEDYTLSYENNVNVGTATVTIEGTGNYTGTAAKTFAILPQELTSVEVSQVEALGYKGELYLTKLTVVNNGTELVRGIDFETVEEEITEEGTVSFGISGIGNYAGTVQENCELIDLDTMETFTLPATIKTVEEEAFVGIPAQVICIPEDCREIKSGAFADCPALRAIELPGSLESIAEDAFEGNEPLWVIAPEGSKAEDWAEARGFEIIK